MRWQLVFNKVSSEGDIREKVVKKLAELEKYLQRVGSDLKKGVVRLSRGERWGYKVKVEVNLPGKDVAVEGRGKELLSALDEAHHKAARVVRKYFERLKKRGRD